MVAGMLFSSFTAAYQVTTEVHVLIHALVALDALAVRVGRRRMETTPTAARRMSTGLTGLPPASGSGRG